jgi:glycine cleavage system aminomethyltransferase T
MRALRAAFENQAVLKALADLSSGMPQSSTWCYLFEVPRTGAEAAEAAIGRGVRVQHRHDRPAEPEALLAARGQPLRKKLVTIVLDDPAAYAWGGETLSLGGEPVGELSSAGWGWAAGRCVALGYVRGDAAAVVHARTPVSVDLWGEAVGARAWDRWSAQTR